MFFSGLIRREISLNQVGYEGLIQGPVGASDAQRAGRQTAELFLTMVTPSGATIADDAVKFFGSSAGIRNSTHCLAVVDNW